MRNVYKVRIMEFGFIAFVKVFNTSESIFIADNFDYLEAGIAIGNVRKYLQPELKAETLQY